MTSALYLEKINVDTDNDDDEVKLITVISLTSRIFSYFRSIINPLMYTYVKMSLDSHGRDEAVGDP